jgi:TolA-binding protein
MRPWMSLLAVGLALAAAGCDSAHRAARSGRAEIERRAEAQVDSLDAQLAAMRARIASLSTQARARAEAQLGPLERRRDEVKGELAELRALGDSAWARARVAMPRQMAGLDSLRQRIAEMEF